MSTVALTLGALVVVFLVLGGIFAWVADGTGHGGELWGFLAMIAWALAIVFAILALGALGLIYLLGGRQ